MFIHFSFGGLRNKIGQQVDAFIKNIIAYKRLKFSRNPEFIPVFQPHIHPKFRGKKVYRIPPERFKPTGNGMTAHIADLQFIRPENDIYYLPYEIGMICFIKIPFKQLRKSPHPLRYGKLGLVFTDNFLKEHKVKAVNYQH